MTAGTSKDKGHLINKPKQQRSLTRYHHILDTAAQMFAHQGYENVGTNHIAAQAGVSVGSLYRFFSSKEAVVEALVERYITNLEAALPQVIKTDQPMAHIVRAMLEGVFEFDRRNASFAQILTTTQAGQLAHGAIQMHVTLKHWVESLLRLYHPHLSQESIHLCAASGMGIVKGMLTMTQPPDLIPIDIVIVEMVDTLMSYVEAFVNRHK